MTRCSVTMGVVAIDNHMVVQPININLNVIKDILINGKLEANVISKELKPKL